MAVTGGLADDNYDPHKHRNPEKPTTYGETMMHMLKGCVGAGLLAMPNALYRTGLIFGGVGILLIGVFATYCIQILILSQYEICKRARQGYIEYRECMRLAIQSGPPCLRWSARYFAGSVDFFLVMYQIGVCSVYCVFVAENLKLIMSHYGTEIQIRLLIICFYPVLLAMGMIKNLKKLTPLSTFSNCMTMIGLVFVFFYLVEDDVIVDTDKFKLKGVQEIPIFIGMVLFALEAVGVMLSLEYNMEKPSDFTGLFGLFTLGMAIISVLYCALGIFGYLKYGSEAKGSVTLNLPYEQNTVVAFCKSVTLPVIVMVTRGTKAQAAMLCFTFALFFSFPLQNYAGYEILWRKILEKNPKNPQLLNYLLRIACVTIPFILAVAAPNLGPFMGLLGCFCLSMSAVVFPAIMDVCTYYPGRYGPGRYKLFLDIFIVIFGTFCMFSGCYTSILEMAETYV